MSVARVLCRKEDNPVDPTTLHAHQKGDVVSIIDTAESPEYSQQELMHNVGITITTGTFSQIKAYEQRWYSDLVHQQQQLSVVDDIWQVALSMSNVGQNNYGALTKQQVEDYLTQHWNITPTEIKVNLIEFTEPVFEVAISPHMLGTTPRAVLDNITFTQVAYNEETGVHDIKGDYSATQLNPDGVARAVSTFYEILSRDDSTKEIVFRAPRIIIFREFEEDANIRLANVDERENGLLSINKMRIQEAHVDAIISAGGVVERTLAEAEAMLVDKQQMT